MTQEELKIIISAQTASLQRELKDVRKQLGDVDKSSSDMSKSMQDSFNKTIGSISKFKAVMVASFGAAAIAAKRFIGNLMDSGNELLTLASQTGMTTDRLQELQYAANQTGASADRLQRAVLHVSKAVESGDPVFRELGITSRDTAEAFEQGIIALSRMEESTYKNELGNRLLGRSYADLKPLIDQGAEGLAQLRGEAHATGAVMSGALIQQIETLRTSMHNLRTSFQAAFYPILEVVIPILQRLVGWLQTATMWTRALIGLFFKVGSAGGSVATGMNQASVATKGFGTAMGKAGGSTGRVAKGVGGIKKGLNQATKAAKELDRQLMGFDVIHNITEPSSTGAGAGSGGSAGSGGAGGGIGLPGAGGMALPDFGELGKGLGAIDSANDKIREMQDKILELRDSILKWIDDSKGMLKLVGWTVIVGAAFAGLMKVMKMGGFGALLQKVTTWVAASKLPAFLKTILDYGIVKLIPAFATLQIWLEAAAASVAVFLESIGLSSVASAVFLGVSAPMVLVIIAIAVAIASVVMALIDLYRHNEEFRTQVQDMIANISESMSYFYNTIIEPIFTAIKDIILIVIEKSIKPMWRAFVDLVGAVTTPLLKMANMMFPIFKEIIRLLGVVLTPVLDVLKVGVNVLMTVFGTFGSTIIKIVTKLVNIVMGAVTKVVGFIIDVLMPPFSAFIDMLVQFYEDNKEIFKEIYTVIKTTIDNLIKRFQEFIANMKAKFVDKWGDQWNTAKETVTKVAEVIKNVIGILSTGILSNIGHALSGITGAFRGLLTFVKGVFTGDWRMAWDGVVKIFSSLFGIIPKVFKTTWDTVMRLFSGGGKIFKGFASSVADIFKKLVNSLIRGINTVIGAPFKALNRALSTFKGISILGAKPFSWLPTIGIPTIPAFATGGFPEDGLFHANSNELVGKFTNGKTAVANNAQIVEGVSAGVAQAVQSVMGGKDNQAINLTVQIGSDTIAKKTIDAIDDYTNRTGYTFKTV